MGEKHFSTPLLDERTSRSHSGDRGSHGQNLALSVAADPEGLMKFSILRSCGPGGLTVEISVTNTAFHEPALGLSHQRIPAGNGIWNGLSGQVLPNQNIRTRVSILGLPASYAI